MTDLVARLRAEEERMLKLFDLVVSKRDLHTGPAFADLNAIKHALSGRDRVLTEAADQLEEARADHLRVSELLTAAVDDYNDALAQPKGEADVG